MLQNNILLILLESVFHLKRSRINEQWKRLYQKFPLSWCIMQQLKNIQKATLLSRLCRSPLSHCEQHLSDSFILIYSIVYNRGPNINQCKAKMMSERFKRMCEQNKHILLYFQLIFPHSCENTGCDGNGRELMAVLSHILVVELLSRGSYNISLRPNKLHPPMGDGVRTVPVKPRSPHSHSWWNICFCPRRQVHAQICRGKDKLTAIRSRVPFTAAHRSCRRSITRMNPTPVDDKLEHTRRKHFQHKLNRSVVTSLMVQGWES